MSKKKIIVQTPKKEVKDKGESVKLNISFEEAIKKIAKKNNK